MPLFSIDDGYSSSGPMSPSRNKFRPVASIGFPPPLSPATVMRDASDVVHARLRVLAVGAEQRHLAAQLLFGVTVHLSRHWRACAKQFNDPSCRLFSPLHCLHFLFHCGMLSTCITL